MVKNKQWGTNIELTAAAELLQVPVLVTTDLNEDENFQIWIHPKQLSTTDVLLLGFAHTELHYYSLEGKTLFIFHCNNNYIVYNFITLGNGESAYSRTQANTHNELAQSCKLDDSRYFIFN